jgi:hypothetical protein
MGQVFWALTKAHIGKLHRFLQGICPDVSVDNKHSLYAELFSGSWILA